VIVNKTTLIFSFSLLLVAFSCNNSNKVNECRTKSSDEPIDSQAWTKVESNDNNKITIIEQPNDNITDTVLAIVRKLRKVQKLEKEVEDISKDERHISYRVFFDDSAKTIYDVQVGEDNGMSVVAYFHFRVNAMTLKVLNPDGKD
jgi:hypothetical protein